MLTGNTHSCMSKGVGVGAAAIWNLGKIDFLGRFLETLGSLLAMVCQSVFIFFGGGGGGTLKV